MLITSQGFTTALAWLKTGIEGRREFAPLQSDLDELHAIEASGFEHFQKEFAQYTPGRLDPYRVPKGSGKFRDVFYMPVFDRVVTLGLLLSDYDKLRHSIHAASSGTDYHTPLPVDAADAQWFLRYKDEYAAFRTRTHGLQKSHHHMAFTDITNFAPSSSHVILHSKLLSAGMDPQRAFKFIGILKTWAKNDGLTGTPQGYCMTDLVSKIYLRGLDSHIRWNHKDVQFYRYNDDLRLASIDPEALKAAFGELVLYCGNHRLKISDQKTVWHRPGQAQNKAKDSIQVEPYLQPCWDGLRLTDKSLADSPRDVGELDLNDLPVNFLRALGNQYLQTDIPSTLFNFIIRRMGKKGIGLEQDRILALADGQPERLSIVLEYTKQLHDAGRSVGALIAPLHAVCSTEPYDQYLYVRFLDDLKALPEARTMTLQLAGHRHVSAPVFLQKALEGAVKNVSTLTAAKPAVSVGHAAK